MDRWTLLGVVVAVFALGAVSSYAVLGTDLVSRSSSDGFEAAVDMSNGTNRFVMVEVDEGDNNEEQQVEEILHEFMFSATGVEGLVVWDFSDGTTATGTSVVHAFERPGQYEVTATHTLGSSVEVSTVQVEVDLHSEVEVDNMECVCAPTAKDSIVQLTNHRGEADLQGFVRVEHDGSSESCALRNPLQECHLRVIYELLEDEQLIASDVLFDDTFRSNELVVDFAFMDTVLEDGQRVQLRLETDQLRDWHKPNAEWTTSAPIGL